MPHGKTPGLLSFEFHNAESRFITSGPIGAVTAHLFFPLAFSMASSATVGIVDMYLAGFLGSNAQAAVGLGDQLLYLVIVLGTGLATACSSFVSRAAGAGDILSCKIYAKASLIFGMLVGIGSNLAGYFCPAAFLAILGCESKVAELAIPYTAYNSFANCPFIISLVLAAIFRAMGQPKLSIYLWLITALISNGLSFVLFFSSIPGLHSLTALAIAWDVGSVIGCLCGFLILLRLFKSLTGSLIECKHGLPLPCKKSGGNCESRQGCRRSQDVVVPNDSALIHTATVEASPEMGNSVSLINAACDLITIGVPAVISELCFIVSQFLIYRLLADLPESATLQAAWTIKLKLKEMIAQIPLMALGMSTAVIVGQNLGADQKERAIHCATRICKYAAISMFVLGAFITMGSAPLAAFFSQDQQTVISTSNLLFPSVILLPLTALSNIICAAMEGAGQTRAPMILNLLFQVGSKFALAYYFAVERSMHLDGMALGLCLSQLLMLVGSLVCAVQRNVGKAGRGGSMIKCMERIMTSP